MNRSTGVKEPVTILEFNNMMVGEIVGVPRVVRIDNKIINIGKHIGHG